MDKGDQRPSARILDSVNGFKVSQALHVASTLRLADLLKDGPRSSDDLAAATGTHPASLYRLLRALAAIDVFLEDSHRRFALTPLGECLRSDATEPVAPWAVFIGQPEYWQAWGHLLDSVRTGEHAFRHVHGMNTWEYYARNPEAGAAFDGAMTSRSRRQANAVLNACDFKRFACVVDVGGGHGLLLSAILANHPPLRGVLFDQPHVVAGSEPVLRAAGVADRCQVVGGDFFESVPHGGDAYVLKFILHDWEDEQATVILRNCRRAIAPNGKLLVIESEISPPNEGATGKFLDLTMLVHTGGRERTREEWTALFATAGFRMVGATPTEAQASIIEGVPV
ncbi:MAG TPA: methyltransferase [bacterium]|nr:methyltransferase [bacterium]